MYLKKILLPLFILAVLFTSCGGNNSQTAANGKTAGTDKEGIMGAGATFPYPFYSKVFDVYFKEKGIKVNYQSIGSGGGIKQLQNKTVDFGASDAPMSDDELSKSPAPIVHIPTCLGAVIVSYNLPGNPVLKFTPDVLADIFLGKITKWNDQRITSVNPGVQLPDLPVSVVHRSDGSGTTYIFSDYLSKISAAWKAKPGTGKSLDWPVGLGAKGNEGVSGMVKQTPGSIGYVELVYALQNKMPAAQLQNKAGNFVSASLQSTSAAANTGLPADMRVSLTNTDAPDGYPISSFTYLLIYKNQQYDDRTETKAKGTVDLINFVLHDGQQYAKALGYAPLPAEAVNKAEEILKSVTYADKPLE
ncbi:MAG: phosphate ABC transporter substrate-binding protein PstS [Chitinophagaceae bacterium]|nr:phosphate ABC transporter substrate-binding protein PstS [Chitinophagaceae bacterium]